MEDYLHSKSDEIQLIGAVLLEPDLFEKIDIMDEDFYILRNRTIWETFGKLKSKGMDIDSLAVIDDLVLRGIEERNTGMSYLTEIFTKTVSSLGWENRAKIIKDKSRRRKMMLIANDMAKSALSEEQLDDSIPELMTRMISNTSGSSSTKPITHFLSKLYDQVDERARDPKDIYGIQTGIDDFDAITSGLQKGELTILSGEAGLGKSMIALQMAFGAATHKHPTAVYELEMGGIQTVRRNVSMKSGISTHNMRTGRMSGDDFTAFAQAVEKLSELPIYMSDDSDWTTSAMRADLIRLKSQYGIELFVVDYLFLLSDRYGKDDSERLGYTCKSLKSICKDLDLSCIAIHSITKAGLQNGIPRKEDLRGSGQLMNDADMIIFLVNDEKNPNMVKIIFDKYREDDPSRFVSLVRKPGFPGFYNLARP
jgi:replicative DNA helicase